MPLKKGLFTKLLVGKDNEYLHENWFLQYGMNMDKQIDEYNTIHFTHKGTIGGGVIKNPVYPLPLLTRTDLPDSIECAPYATPAGLLPSIDTHGLPYDKRKSVLKDLREEMLDDIVREGIWNTSPYEDTLDTPIIMATGPVVNGYKSIIKADIQKFRTAVNKRYPGLTRKKWVMILESEDFWELVNNDSTLQMQIAYNNKVGDLDAPKRVVINEVEIREDNRLPFYDGTTQQRLPFGSVPVLGTDLKVATAFIGNKSFIKGFGKLEFFDNKKEALYQADIVSLLQHAYIGPPSKDLQSNLKFLGGIKKTP
jgi:hypothetical protein